MLTRTKKRNGLILLVVLGMLALFSIITVSFVVFSSNSNKASTMVAQVKLRQPNSRQLASLTLKQILRGTTDVQSAFYGHDLLGDIYGQAALINERARLVHNFVDSRPATIGEFQRDLNRNAVTNIEQGVYVINSMGGTPAFLRFRWETFMTDKESYLLRMKRTTDDCLRSWAVRSREKHFAFCTISVNDRYPIHCVTRSC